MNTKILKVANGIGPWLISAFIVTIVIVQSVLYTRLAYRTGDKLGMKKETCNKALKVGMVTAIGPVMAIFIIMVGLMAVIGGPMAWMRLSIIGSAPTELTSARVGAEALGVTFGGEDYDLTALATSWWTMAINGCGWLLVVGFFTPKFEIMREKIGEKDQRWLGIFTAAATLGAFGYLNSGDIVKGGGNLVAVIAGAVCMMALGIVVEKIPKFKPIKEYSLGIAMVIGVFFAIVIS